MKPKLLMIDEGFNLSGAGIPRFTLTNCTYSIQNIIKKPGQFAQTGLITLTYILRHRIPGLISADIFSTMLQSADWPWLLCLFIRLPFIQFNRKKKPRGHGPGALYVLISYSHLNL